ncbi:IS66 family transposase [Actinokineospora sp.]|uniref:IS66 family transposase n=1 Tax=Actinokineospora sp. TaxID=1872133 RepID=UPI003D6B3A6D
MSQGELASVVAELRVVVARLEATVAELNQAVTARDARIAELEKLLEASRRSGKRQSAPFSKGQGSVDPAKPGRKAGDEHGRHGHRAAPVHPPDRELEAPLPGCCPHCGGDVELEREDEQFQVDLPPIRPVTTRFRVGVGRCTTCRRRVQGRHPEQTSDALGAAGSQVGPTAKSWGHWAHYGLGLSFGKCSELLRRLGIDVTAGALCQAAQSTGSALVPVHAEIVRRVNASPVVTADETGWRVGGRSAWLWVVTAQGVTAYNVADGRGFEEACEVLDAGYDGVLVRDGWGPYRLYEKATHQSCVAHFLRRCNEMIDDNPGWARGTPRHVKDMLLDALAARDLGARRRKALAADLIDRIEILADQAHPYDANRKLVAHLHNERHALFTFLTHPDVPATNWKAEQGVRPAVVNRKVWGGNRTWRGAATQSRIMSVLRTAAQQGVDAIDWLTRYARAPDLALSPLFTE